MHVHTLRGGGGGWRWLGQKSTSTEPSGISQVHRGQAGLVACRSVGSAATSCYDDELRRTRVAPRSLGAKNSPHGRDRTPTQHARPDHVASASTRGVWWVAGRPAGPRPRQGARGRVPARARVQRRPTCRGSQEAGSTISSAGAVSARSGGRPFQLAFVRGRLRGKRGPQAGPRSSARDGARSELPLALDRAAAPRHDFAASELCRGRIFTPPRRRQPIASSTAHPYRPRCFSQENESRR